MAVPVIAPATGNGLTVTIWVAAVVPQVFVTEYNIVAVPVDTPPTVPPIAVAMPVLALLHTPPVAPSVNEVVDPAHTIAVPVIVPADDVPLTVTTWVAAVVPQVFVTV
jgi:hypothetical protein